MHLSQVDLKGSFFKDHAGAAILAGSDFGTVVSKLLPNTIIAAGVIFFFLILGSGFMMIKNSGGEHNPQDAAKAKSAVTFSMVGFLLIVSAYFILQIVGSILGVDFTNSII